MHGILFTELRNYISIKSGKETWDDLLKNAGLGARIYIPSESYPDDEMTGLVTVASRAIGQPAGKVLQDFGEFIAPDFLIMYKGLIKPQWRTLDVLENLQNAIQGTVREGNPEVHFPEIVSERLSSEEVVITYSSARKMCTFAKGVIKGMAAHYHEKIAVTESSCMLKGDAACVISVKLVK